MPIKGVTKVDPVLTGMSIAIANESDEYVSNDCAPVIRVPKSTGEYYEFPEGVFYQTAQTPAAACSPWPEIQLETNTRSFKSEVYKSAVPLCEQQIADSDDNIIRAQTSAMTLATSSLLLGRELNFAAKFLTPGATVPWETETDVSLIAGGNYTSVWTDPASDPIRQIRDCSCGIKETGGKAANRAIFGYKAWCCFLDNPAVVARTAMSGGGPERSMDALMRAASEILGIEVKVMSANTVVTPGTLGFVNSNAVLVAYVADAPDLWTPSAMYNFAWDYADLGEDNTISMRTIMDEDCESMKIAGKLSYGFEKISPKMGCLLYNVC